MKNALIVCLLLTAGHHALAQDSFSSVEERMTGKEFMEAGLNKLSEAELEALNKWLRAHSVATLEDRVVRSGATNSTATIAGAPQVGTSTIGDSRGLENKNNDRSTIVSRLIGEFEGWDGETVFELENGMVWKQEETDYFTTKKMVNPEITIKSGMFNSWRLSVENYNKSVEVVRIQ